jgi:hypothetical protein
MELRGLPELVSAAPNSASSDPLSRPTKRSTTGRLTNVTSLVSGRFLGSNLYLRLTSEQHSGDVVAAVL